MYSLNNSITVRYLKELICDRKGVSKSDIALTFQRKHLSNKTVALSSKSIKNASNTILFVNFILKLTE